MKVFRQLPIRLVLLFLLFLVVLTSESWAAGRSEIAADSQFLVSSEILQAKAEEIERANNIDAGMKKKLLELYHKSLGNLERAASYDTLAGKFTQTIETAPADIKKIREKLAELERLPEEYEKEFSEAIPVQDLEKQLLKTKSQLTEIQAKVTALDHQFSVQSERPVKAKLRLSEIKKEEKELMTALKASTPEEDIPQLSEAKRWLRQTQLQVLANETKMLNQELVSMPVLVELTNAERDEAVTSLKRTRIQTQQLVTEINRKHQADAAKSMDQAEKAMRQVDASSPLVQQTAAANVTLSDELQSLTAAEGRIAAEKESLDQELKAIEENFRSARKRIEMAGLSQAVGLLLFQQSRTLPNIQILKKKAATNDETIAEIGLLQLQHIEARKRLDDIEAYLLELASGVSPDDLSNIRTELRKLLISQRKLLDKIIAANQSYLGALADLNALHRQLLTTVADFDAFLAGRLLWIRTLPSMRVEDFQTLPIEAAALIASSKWHEIVKQLVNQVSSPIFVVVCLLTGLFLWFKSSIIARLEKTVSLAGNSVTYRFSMPLQAVGWTLLLALPGPLLVITLAWQMQHLIETTDFSRAVSTGLIVLSFRFFLLRSFRVLLMPKGLAAGFFHWSKESIRLLRTESRFLMVGFLPVIFITQVIFQANFHVDGKYLLGRLFLIGTLCTIFFFIYRVLHPKTGVWHRFVAESPHRVLVRLYPFFFFFVMLLPLVLSGLTVAGFVIAAGALTSCLINTLWVAFGLVICHQLIERWLIQSSRRLARIKVMKLRAAAAASTASESEQMVTEKDVRLKAELAEDLIVLSAESRKMLDTMVFLAVCGFLWLVWADVLPALRIFNDFNLWTYSSVIKGETTMVPVTLADGALAVLIGIITLTASRHFPSLLVIVLMKHLDMSAGARYTVTTLSGYIIGATGLLSIASILGFSWSKIQWLVAALGVGIGFGLQEIVTNFISGIIILFERPIRVADVVTIGETDGVVTRIRIRVTTIRDYDRKELLVPNKEFISGRLLNWSLSDPLLRILVPVGIAYGSDVQEAMRLMKKAAEENALVLDDPKPVVMFDSFGDNSLLLTLHCFIDSVDKRLLARSLLHQAIDQRFREVEISIAFPQHDIHLDINKPIDIRVVQESGAFA